MKASTLRTQLQRSRLAHSGGKRLDVHLTAQEVEILDAYRMARGLPNITAAIKSLIEPHLARMGDPAF